MTCPVETIDPEASVANAAARTHNRGISAPLVTTAPPSIVTATDTLDILAERPGPDGTDGRGRDDRVRRDGAPSLDVGQAAQMMTTYGISHLPVVDDDYVGMVSSTDVTDLQS